ncbi:radical SAM protein [Paracoccus denitrificans]|uniref:radical SAM protein n=1 Tax=Paracoccus denitrificans TaxID=266 RepID=UPI000CEBD438|nr:radical SAM protein [Paracoccus denitrificans]
MESREAKSLDLIVKVAERCNIACTYCYFFFGGDESHKFHPPYVNEETAAEIEAFLDRITADGAVENLMIYFHGGEPMMAPKPVIARIARAARRLSESGRVADLGLSMQTNGMLVNDAWIRFCADLGIGVGVSLDGDEAANDRFRIDKKGRGTYRRAVQGFRRLAGENGAGIDLHPGLLSVIDPEGDGARRLEHFSGEIGAQRMNFLHPDGGHDQGIAPAQVAGVENFMLGVFRAWVRRRDSGLRVRFIKDLLDTLLSDEGARTCPDSARRLSRILTISSNGMLGAEDTARTLDARFRDIGHVRDFDSVAQIFATPALVEMQQAAATPPAACAACPWWGTCRGGTFTNRYSAQNGFDNPSVYCDALKAFFEEVSAWLVRGGIPVEDIERRLILAGSAPEAVLGAARAEPEPLRA